ncbi:uroporphyrinogen-III C-methyltransferase [Bradyrhizobium diazoefficiens]|nr:uroporphyrinogen-III C-methyltransferase [Bradyrhizobium diazoefficiens]UCF52297.1 MAG: uroporphyrinogen-III C-methyltransferase [Bradyrhizobium sp.]MBR0963931.1 uroporphyrinogen-III C-methyltransferase [Bradyrhizobium diazoefficiens]MBR0978082.1 uroporphyrinogen-III C-methyltransferase [Bradyrhizobium diazoefficiens]MBR1007591.1 uroporphyrinogen-III C-methyltransferase [Bradyrhizobium diazoefficiens]MBR1012566.1 uroporphyrinogen-III C-methyltransferase [Bradyrhizobium diazoefficiens]
MSGFVSFISAGPGDPELMTLKGAARLREADVVLYDDLASGAVLDLARPGANLVAVGKRAGRPSTKQHHVSRLLVDYAATGVRVARLKSGDAGIFGRLEEEIETLREAGIGYEIIPGVTTACVAAAHAGIPLTRRHTSRRVQFITGADVTGELPQNLNWVALADPEATTVVYMGRRTFPTLVAKLIAHGLAPTTPALFAESLASSDERLIRTTIAELAEQIARGGAASTASLILFGALAGEYPSWRTPPHLAP